LNNLFGTTFAGKNNIPYPSVTASGIAWENNWGTYLTNPPQTIQAFTTDLTSNQNHMYNANPTWPTSVADDYHTLQNRFKNCNITFPSVSTGLPHPTPGPRQSSPVRPQAGWEGW